MTDALAQPLPIASVSLKEAFVAGMLRLAEDPRFIYLDADLMHSIGTDDWTRRNPDRAINVGIAEANMIGIAAGLASVGWRPLVHTFAAFASRRCFDQVFLSAGYARLPMTVMGSDPGVTAAYNGGTHMPFEDIAMYRTIPDAWVVDVSTPAMLAALMPILWRKDGVKYIRFGRKNAVELYPANKDFLPGRAIVLRDGKDAAIFAAGIMVAEALTAARILAEEGLSVAVIDMFTIKPLDQDVLLRYAQMTGALVSAENHRLNGGLGEAIAGVLARCLPSPLETVGVGDVFGEVGSQAELQVRFGLTADHIAAAVHRVILRRNRGCAGSRCQSPMRNI